MSIMTSLLRSMAVFACLGLFFAPMAHAQHTAMPAGMSHEQHMAQMAEIAYTFEETDRGGIVRISTRNVEARAALHEFLTYQIKEHATGDPVSLQNDAARSPDHGAQTGGAHAAPATQADHFGRHFDNADEWAKSLDDPARDEWQMPARVIDALQLKSWQLVADIGAGTGYSPYAWRGHQPPRRCMPSTSNRRWSST